MTYNDFLRSKIVAAQEGRRFIGIELNPDYAALAQRRIEQACLHCGAPMTTEQDKNGDYLPLR